MARCLERVRTLHYRSLIWIANKLANKTEIPQEKCNPTTLFKRMILFNHLSWGHYVCYLRYTDLLEPGSLAGVNAYFRANKQSKTSTLQEPQLCYTTHKLVQQRFPTRVFLINEQCVMKPKTQNLETRHRKRGKAKFGPLYCAKLPFCTSITSVKYHRSIYLSM